MYPVAYETSMGCVLEQHDETRKKEQATYNLRKKLADYESLNSSL